MMIEVLSMLRYPLLNHDSLVFVLTIVTHLTMGGWGWPIYLTGKFNLKLFMIWYGR
jgi:hypothetical protein